ncbi:uncharacterized protein BXIN_0799 [Babesia sp. Xinjiang]|uniref:uncharacterized protein n=1 Tax=Babesia sp. Xinjiang TaxID=462227 RepID=UPI000A2632BB|nr:uncharacterized protein BXIN_0799 [Babesia sp. Xinjiang]ORM41326.1 hypothetical protein BXIN_0799 [Babesia sp. Xinjiang]
MRVIPVVVQDDEEPLPHQCAIVSIRPYSFWVKKTKDSPALPYMFPKYTSREVVGEEFEAKMLSMPTNQRLLVVATMIGAGLLPTDQRQMDIASALKLWLTEIDGTRGPGLTDQLSHLQEAVSNFTPQPLLVSDESIFSADFRDLFTWNWPWDPRLLMHREFERSYQLALDDRLLSERGDAMPKLRRGSRHTGCIRYENNRHRWVVDLSVNGCRMQKCFHENQYGLVGGLQEARRWRLDYIRSTHNEFDIESEERIVNDLVDKIIALEDANHAELLVALSKPIPGYEHILDERSLCDIVNGRLVALGLQLSAVEES